MNTIKLLGVFFIILIILDLVLFVMGVITTAIFWIVVILCAIVAYKGLPWLKTKLV